MRLKEDQFCQETFWSIQSTVIICTWKINNSDDCFLMVMDIDIQTGIIDPDNISDCQ